MAHIAHIFESARIEQVPLDRATEATVFYQECMKATERRGKPIDWQRMTRARVTSWVINRVLYQVMWDRPIRDPVDGRHDTTIGPFTYRLATFIADHRPDTRIWTPEEASDVPTAYLAKFAINPRVMGSWTLPALMPKLKTHLRDRGYHRVRFDHIPPLNDYYDELGVPVVGSATFTGVQGDEVYVVKREMPLDS